MPMILTPGGRWPSGSSMSGWTPRLRPCWLHTRPSVERKLLLRPKLGFSWMGSCLVADMSAVLGLAALKLMRYPRAGNRKARLSVIRAVLVDGEPIESLDLLPGERSVVEEMVLAAEGLEDMPE